MDLMNLFNTTTEVKDFIKLKFLKTKVRHEILIIIEQERVKFKTNIKGVMSYSELVSHFPLQGVKGLYYVFEY